MMKFRKFLTIGIAALTVAAFSFGLAACKPDPEDPGKDPETPGGDTPVTPAEVTVEGGYGIYFADQGGLGLEVNLYEDGTYYFSQFTSNIVYGEYTAEAATGTDSDGRTIHYTVTFDDSVNFGEGPHNIVSDSEGSVYLTGMYDDMSNATYSFTKQDNFVEEVVQTVEQFWSVNYATDFVTVTFYSDETYALDGVNGAGQAGSLGTYTSETAEDGTVTYTMTDGDDSSKVYSITVAGSSITLTGGESDYTMTSTNPMAVIELTMTATNSWGASVVLTGYDDSSCNVEIELAGVIPKFIDASGTWSYLAADDMYVIILNGTTYTAENDGTGGYSFEYAIASANFGGEKVTLTYKSEVPMVAYTFVYTNDWSYDLGTEITMTARAQEGAAEYTFTGDIWDGLGTLTITLAGGGSVTVVADAESVGAVGVEVTTGTWEAGEDGSLAITINGNSYTAVVSE